eukprot:gnl/MRDRNA2_/MRDRNA2_169041_c0_seq1.p1 gnl/MRDRNA2_/MRDRNA2_169041_c0~~gnl/MRDRNA2_/MRDRNA2_169041_c0_seq1.p1  ORF type:complete len:287 (-),score=45.95 gnl/MRDRNA2_/MRDRNA2_169041_c0_seq1:324-1184(-)
MALSLFGRQIPEFSTFDRAFTSCFRVLMGDFDYEAMFAEARLMGTIWFWLFQTVLVLLMLNMLLAIIMDTYTEVKGLSSNKETLPEQLGTLLRRWRWIREGQGLSLDTIDEKLTQVYGKTKKKVLKNLSTETVFAPEDILTVEKFAEAIEGLHSAQAERLITMAVKNWHLEHLEPLTMSEAMNVISLTHRYQMEEIVKSDKNYQEQSDRMDSLEQQLNTIQSAQKSMQSALERIEGLLHQSQQTSSPEQPSLQGPSSVHKTSSDVTTKYEVRQNGPKPGRKVHESL